MKRLGIISLFAFLFIAFIVVWNFSYQTGLEGAYTPVENSIKTPLIPSESAVFQRSEFAIDYSKMKIDENHQRSLNTYYKNRAFHGAPPSIPHAVESELNMGGNTCLKCHENGGFVSKFNAYAPVSPHPDLINCRQCHVPQTTKSLFVASNFPKLVAPKVGVNNPLRGSPPVIPHQIQLHENCLACHAGPSAPKEIRVMHPEQINCKQCHVLNDKETSDIGIFIRQYNDEQ